MINISHKILTKWHSNEMEQLQTYFACKTYFVENAIYIHYASEVLE